MLKFKELGLFTMREFVFGGHLFSIGAASAGVLLLQITGQPIHWAAIFTIYLIFEPVYMFDRFIGFRSDSSENPERTGHIAAYVHRLPLIIAGYVVLTVIIAALSRGLTGVIISLILLSFGIAYGHAYKRLTRFIPLFKNIYVALAWTLATLYIVTAGQSVWAFGLDDVLLITFIFLLALFIEIYLDMKDIRADAHSGYKTLPVLLGRDGAFRALFAFTLIVGLPVVFGVQWGVLPQHCLALLIVLPVNWGVLMLSVFNQRRVYFAFVALEYIFLLIFSSASLYVLTAVI